MLKINLLPQEYREADRTPIAVFLTVVLCTILGVSAICCVAYLYFGMLKHVETMRDIAKEEYDNLAPMARYADDLDKEKREYTKRSEVIKEIETTRILWTKKIDQLVDMIDNGGDIERHWAWLQEMKIKMSAGGVGDSGLEIKGYVVGGKFERLSDFNKDIRNHDLFLSDFETISNPTGSIQFEKKMVPPEAISFDWKMELRDLNPKPKKNAKPAGAVAAGNKK